MFVVRLDEGRKQKAEGVCHKSGLVCFGIILPAKHCLIMFTSIITLAAWCFNMYAGTLYHIKIVLEDRDRKV